MCLKRVRQLGLNDVTEVSAILMMAPPLTFFQYQGANVFLSQNVELTLKGVTLFMNGPFKPGMHNIRPAEPFYLAR